MNTEHKKDSLVPQELLEKSNKILFVTHLAIGDFTYLQNFFKAFSIAFPHIKIDLWIDEVRRTRFFWRWKHLKRYALTDWVESCGIFNKIYKNTYSWSRFNIETRNARKEEYPIVVSIAALRHYKYARYIRRMSPNGFIAGIYNPNSRHKCKQLDARLYLTQDEKKTVEHITDIYAIWFKKLFGLDVKVQDRKPFVVIPSEWISYAKLKFFQWGIEEKHKRIDSVVFINPFAKDKKRCWKVSKVVKLIYKLRQDERFKYSFFIINSVPEKYDEVNNYLKQYSLNRVVLFSARENLFQLPAIMSLCDFIISVETSVIHLASALDIPLVALMRRKNPEWGPFDSNKNCIVLAKKRHSWINGISVDEVLKRVALL
jgi:heptosyltransferase III